MAEAIYQIVKKDRMIDYMVECMNSGSQNITVTVSIDKEPDVRPEIMYLSKFIGKSDSSDKFKEFEAKIANLQNAIASIQRDQGLKKEI